MTSTDRAFIAALQQQAVAPPAPVDDGFAVGPHYTPAAGGAKAPLSEHLARRRSPEPATPETYDHPFAPGVEVDGFAWPAMALGLAEKGRQPLFDLLAGLTQHCEASAPTLALVGARPGVGTTTALLALARLVGSVDGRVAVLDLALGHGAAMQLGVRRSAHRTARHDASVVDDLAITGHHGTTTVVALGPEAPEPLVRVAAGRLAATHDLLLIDAGAADDAAHWLHVASATRPQVVIVDAAPSDDDAVMRAVQTLANAGVDTAGVVETFVAG